MKEPASSNEGNQPPPKLVGEVTAYKEAANPVFTHIDEVTYQLGNETLQEKNQAQTTETP